MACLGGGLGGEGREGVDDSEGGGRLDDSCVRDIEVYEDSFWAEKVDEWQQQVEVVECARRVGAAFWVLRVWGLGLG